MKRGLGSREQLEVAPQPGLGLGGLGREDLDRQLDRRQRCPERAHGMSLAVADPHAASLRSTSMLAARAAPGPPCDPDHDRQALAGDLHGRLLGQAQLAEPGRHLARPEAQAPVRLQGPQLLLPVVQEVDDDQPAAGPQHARGLGQHPQRVVGEVQHLVQQHGREAAVGQRQLVHVAMADLAVARLALVQAGTGQRPACRG